MPGARNGVDTTKGACIAVIVLQQSWLECPGEEQGMDLQQRIACSGVVAPQSSVYAASVIANAPNRISFANRITFNLVP